MKVRVQGLYGNDKSESISRTIIVIGMMCEIKMARRDILVGWQIKTPGLKSRWETEKGVETPPRPEQPLPPRPPRLTFVAGDGRQLLGSTPMFLTAGLARRLGRCQGHGGRAGEVARLQEEEGVITAATLGGSWGAVPIGDIQDLPGRGWVMTLRPASSGLQSRRDGRAPPFTLVVTL